LNWNIGSAAAPIRGVVVQGLRKELVGQPPEVVTFGVMIVKRADVEVSQVRTRGASGEKPRDRQPKGATGTPDAQRAPIGEGQQ
jgi:hypothetical protein